MEAEVAAGLNPKNISESKNVWKSGRDISTYPFQATRPRSVLFFTPGSVPLSAAIEIARGRNDASDSKSGHSMSALPPIADIGEGIAECPLMTQSGRSWR